MVGAPVSVVPVALAAVFVVAGALPRSETASDIILCHVISIPADAEENLNTVLVEEFDGPRPHSARDDQVNPVLREKDREAAGFVAGVREIVPPVDDRVFDVEYCVTPTVPEVF